MSDISFGGGNDPEAAPSPRPGLISSSSAPSGERTSQAWAESTAQAPEPTPDPDDSAIASPAIELSPVEARVLGAMIEKSYLTPDVYPMTTNALVTACNQKTNRDPVVDYTAVQIDSTLIELRQRNLVRRVHAQGARSTKHRQTLDEALTLNEQQLALVSVLLLRGPQTIGELRLRTERHDVGFDDLDAVDRCLEGLASRPNPLVRELPRQPGHKENRWGHLLGDGDGDAVGVVSSAPPTAEPATTSVDATAPTSAAVADADLVAKVDALEAEVETLREQLATLASKLGEPLE